MSDRTWQVVIGVGMLVVGLVVGNANDQWRIMGEKTDEAATKGDIAALRADMQPVLAMRGQVERNTQDIDGMDSRQRSMIQTLQMLCGLQDKLCVIQNTLWRPHEESAPVIELLVMGQAFRMPPIPVPAPREFEYEQPVAMPKYQSVRLVRGGA